MTEKPGTTGGTAAKIYIDSGESQSEVGGELTEICSSRGDLLYLTSFRGWQNA